MKLFLINTHRWVYAIIVQCFPAAISQFCPSIWIRMKTKLYLKRILPVITGFHIMTHTLWLIINSFNFSFQYLSDIGGTAGLVLGLSIASVLKHMETFYFNKRDWLKEKISKRMKGWQYRNEISSKEYFLLLIRVFLRCSLLIRSWNWT